MKAILMIFFSLNLVNSYAQEKLNIKNVTIYSLKDTAGIDLKDSLQMCKWKQYKRSYDIKGRLVQEILFPFPHNPLVRTTKIIENQYLGDTLISKVLNGKHDLVSETICINKRNFRECKTIHYGSLNSSFYKELENNYIVLTTKDTINNISKLIKLVENEGKLDTLKIDEKPIFRKQKNASIESSKLIRFDTLDYSNLKLYGFCEVNQNDTLSITYVQELKINNESKLVEWLTINNQTHKIDKTETYWQNKLVKEKVNYELIDGTWNIMVKIVNAYNSNSDMLMKIRDDYRDGLFSYRFVTYFNYEYY